MENIQELILFLSCNSIYSIYGEPLASRLFKTDGTRIISLSLDTIKIKNCFAHIYYSDFASHRKIKEFLVNFSFSLSWNQQ